MDDIIKNTTFPRRWSFRELDFFSGGTSVKIKSDERVKSVLGACITLVIYVLLGLSIYYFLNEFLDTTNPNIQVNSRFNEQPFSFIAEGGGLGGVYMFLLVSNPDQKAGISEPYYLSYDTLKRYYGYTSTYSEAVYEISGLVSKKVVAKPKPVELIPCNQTAWYNSAEFAEASQNNSMIRFIIGNFAICPVFESGMNIFGDDQTLRSGRYVFTLSPCTVGCDPLFAFSAITGISGQQVVAGTFQPVVDTADKLRPFRYEINMENAVPIGVLMQSRATVSLKRIEVFTDQGLIVQNIQKITRAAVNSAIVTYDPTITVGEFIPSSVESFGVKYLPPTPTFTLRLVSSRFSSVTTRTYTTIPTLIGNIGGAVEAIVLVFLVLLHWLQNMYLHNRISYVVGKYLNLPSVMAPYALHRSFISCRGCKKKSREINIAAQSQKVLSTIVDKSLSIEHMSYNQILFRYLIENTYPPEIRELVPVAYIMKEILQSSKVRNNLVHKSNYGLKDFQTTMFQDRPEERQITIIADNRLTTLGNQKTVAPSTPQQTEVQYVPADPEAFYRLELSVPEEAQVSDPVADEKYSHSSNQLASDRISVHNVPPDTKEQTPSDLRSAEQQDLANQYSSRDSVRSKQEPILVLQTETIQELEQVKPSSHASPQGSRLLTCMRRLESDEHLRDSATHLRQGVLRTIREFVELLGVESAEALFNNTFKDSIIRRRAWPE